MSVARNRRDWARAVGVAGAAGLLGAARPSPGPTMTDRAGPPFRYCLNTSTIRGQDLPVDRQARVAAEAGYRGIEPWIGDLDKFAAEGGSLADLGKQIADLGLTVESAIGFPAWIVDDDSARRAGLDEARRCMDVVRAIDGTRLAAPPAGATDAPSLDLDRAAERFARLVDLGRDAGVLPQLEVWGFSHNLQRLAQVAYVAVACGRPDALILADAYHLYKGGSPTAGLAMLNGSAMKVFHVNDYPDLDRSSIQDSDRVYPGDGVGQLPALLATLHAIGFRGALSLEVFNRDYWKQDPLEVARTGLARIKACVEAAGLPT